jgi:hypothetical protein
VLFHDSGCVFRSLFFPLSTNYFGADIFSVVVVVIVVWLLLYLVGTLKNDTLSAMLHGVVVVRLVNLGRDIMVRR